MIARTQMLPYKLPTSFNTIEAVVSAGTSADTGAIVYQIARDSQQTQPIVAVEVVEHIARFKAHKEANGSATEKVGCWF